MEIQAFGYLGVGASNLDDWATFATSTIGMQFVDRANSMRAFRMDDRKQRLFIDRAIEPGTQVFGSEVANAASLDSLAARLEAAGVAAKREPTALADQRCVTGVISFADPAGNRLEAFHGAEIADTSIGSFWGHKGLFEDIGAPPSAVPDLGKRRAPVQVMEGNYERMAGVCPWWDAAAQRARAFSIFCESKGFPLSRE
jgi:hypothetical protein